MSKFTLCLLALTVCALAAVALTDAPADAPDGTPAATVDVTKDVRIFFHAAEQEFNGGACTRLRTKSLAAAGGEVSIFDVDRAALKTFLDANKSKKVVGVLSLVVREVQNGPGKVEAAALDTASEWTEGDKNQAKADPGECSFLAAQTGKKKWTTADNKEVANLRDVFYAEGDKIKTLLCANSLKLNAEDQDKTVRLVLDAKFLDHLARASTCRGIVLFTRDASAMCDFYSKEQAGKKPVLQLFVK